MKIKAYRVTGRALQKMESGEWQENNFELYTINPKKVYKEDSIIIGTPQVEPVKAVIDITDEILQDAEFESYTPRKRKNKEVVEEHENV